MKQIWTVLNEGREKIDSHPFFRWITSEEVPLGSRFIFSPVMIDFIMSFADLNKWFLRYENPEGELQLSINEHTEEDATHSRLFVQNWESLKLGHTLDWSASKGLWWLFHSRECHAVRHFGMDILALAVGLPDARLRFCMMEAIEICGDVFFEYTAPIAALLEEQREGLHVYYGQYHRDRETGHLQSDESCFARCELSAEERARAEAAIACVYDHFLRVLDQLLAYSKRAVADHRGLQQEVEKAYRSELVLPLGRASWHPSFPVSTRGARIHAAQLPAAERIESRVQRLRQHSFLLWLKEGRGSPLERLRAFAPLWGIDVVGYKDFNELVLSYAHPTSAAEQCINGLAADLAAHGALYLQDWCALGLDEVLRWRMIDVITYYFLSDDTEVHRRNMAKVKKHAMRHQAPLIRWWLMFALERANEVLLDATRPVALAAEDELGVTLNYWANRRGLAEMSERAGQFGFLEQEVSAEDLAIIAPIIDTVFDNFEEQFELSHLVAQSGVFSTRPRSLPPPRVSELVMRPPPGLLPKWASGAAQR